MSMTKVTLQEMIKKVDALIHSDEGLTRRRLEGYIKAFGFSVEESAETSLVVVCPRSGVKEKLSFYCHDNLHQKPYKPEMTLLDVEKGQGYVYLLVVGDSEFKAGYIGSSRNCEKRFFQHTGWVQKNIRTTRHIWEMADESKEPVRVFILEKVESGDLLYEEGKWQAAFHLAGYNLPAFNKWKSRVVSDEEALEKEIPDFDEIKSKGRILREYR